MPFLADAGSYVFSIISLTAMRTPFQEKREVDTSRLRAQIAEGFRFLWSHPFLRTCAFLWGLGNFAFPGVLLVIVVVGRRQGLSGGEIGALFAGFSAFLLIGSLVSPLFRRRFSMRAILYIELGTWLGRLADRDDVDAEPLDERDPDRERGEQLAGAAQIGLRLERP